MSIYTENIVDQFTRHLEGVVKKHPKRTSLHECLGILEEEFHEFRMEVFKKESLQDDGLIVEEALDVMVSAARVIEFIQSKHKEMARLRALNQHG